jgi:predicted CoA-substrate-specific enzyme activase
MSVTVGIDVGSSYTKVVLVNEDGQMLGRCMKPTGFKLPEVSETTFRECLSKADINKNDVHYVVSTGIGRHQVAFKDVHVTDLTASARGCKLLFPNTRTALDVGGQTMKASRLDDTAKVSSFRMNDKCAAGTGAFLEKTARYMGFTTKEIGALLATSKEPVSISGVCAVFAESEVINHLSLGAAPADIMLGAVDSLVARSVQLVRRVKAEPEFTLIGGIMRFNTMAQAVREQLKSEINVPPEDMVQFVTALGAAILGQRRLKKLREMDASGSVVSSSTMQGTS